MSVNAARDDTININKSKLAVNEVIKEQQEKQIEKLEEKQEDIRDTIQDINLELNTLKVVKKDVQGLKDYNTKHDDDRKAFIKKIIQTSVLLIVGAITTFVLKAIGLV